MTQRCNNNPKDESKKSCCVELEGLLSPRFFKALCDPNRLMILCRLGDNASGCKVGQIAECCPVDISVVSRHLATLRDAGILKAEKQGKEVYYSVRTSDLVRKLREIADAIEACCPDDTGSEDDSSDRSQE